MISPLFNNDDLNFAFQSISGYDADTEVCYGYDFNPECEGNAYYIQIGGTGFSYPLYKTMMKDLAELKESLPNFTFVPNEDMDRTFYIKVENICGGNGYITDTLDLTGGKENALVIPLGLRATIDKFFAEEEAQHLKIEWEEFFS